MEASVIMWLIPFHSEEFYKTHRNDYKIASLTKIKTPGMKILHSGKINTLIVYISTSVMLL